MAIVLISLVGGRTVPNVLLALHLEPDYLYLIVSQDSVGKGRDYERTLKALPENLKPVKSFFVNPYLLKNTIEHCRGIVQEHEKDKIIINVTVGPKTMAFGAYDVAKEFRQKGVDVEVCYLGGNDLFWVFKESDKPASVKISLARYLTSYGWDVIL